MPRPKASNLFTVDEAHTCMAGLKSVTHEAMEIGARRPAKSRDVFKKILNFRSLSTPHFGKDSAPESRLPTAEPLFSVYTRDYTWTRGSQHGPPCKSEDTLPDPDFCRRPVNAFYTLPQSNFKFMDDHLRSDLVPEKRKKIDFLRQTRNQSLIFS